MNENKWKKQQNTIYQIVIVYINAIHIDLSFSTYILSS